MTFFIQLVGHPSSSRVQVSNILPSAQWASAKLHIAELVRLPVSKCRFFHKGKVLEDTFGTLYDCRIKYGDVVLVQEISDIDSEIEVTSNSPVRSLEPLKDHEDITVETYVCGGCKKKPRNSCRECGCHECGSKDDSLENVVCDECNLWFHWSCIDPPLTSLPEDDWYCLSCKNDTNAVILPGVHHSTTKIKKASTKKWGSGMANAGHTKVCTIVPSTHRGPIPGIEVGQTWKYRLQCGEDGVHRPPISGIAGNAASGGAVSIVLSDGYPDDVDNGDDFIYTGSGGKSTSIDEPRRGSRTGAQTCDQELTGANKHLAATCDAPVSEDGATARDWRKSKGIRVVRSYKVALKHPEYAPVEGYRYDGIYKVVRYYPQVGKSGYQVYRFEFRRDDSSPAPWTTEGKWRILNLGLEMVLPTGVRSASSAEASKKPVNTSHENSSSPLRGRKRLLSEISIDDESSFSSDLDESSITTAPSSDEGQNATYSTPETGMTVVGGLPKELEALIHKLTSSKPAHELLFTKLREGHYRNMRGFVALLEKELQCPICQDFVQIPVSNPCGHIGCLDCLKSCVRSEFGPRCPLCRAVLINDEADGEESKATIDKDGERLRAKWNETVEIDEDLIRIIRFCVPDYCQGAESKVVGGKVTT